MDELNTILRHATSLMFNPANEPDGVSAIGISFANEDYPKQAIELLKIMGGGKKLTISFSVEDVLITLVAKEEADNTDVLRISLNFDEIELKDFAKKCPTGSFIYIVFGLYQYCQFYVIDSKQINANYQPFKIMSY